MPRFHDSNGGYGGESRYTPYGGRSNGFHSSSRNRYDDRNGQSNGNDGYRGYNDRDSNRDAPKDEPYHREDISEDELFKTQSNTGINFDKYDNIPVEIFGKDAPAPITSFEEAQLPRVLMENISYAKYTKPTPVQKYSIPVLAMQKRDLMACAQTGSGKTAGFLFPIIARLLSEERQSNRDGRVATPSVLILSPTRELTTQIYDECRKFIYKTGLRTTVVYGGTDARHQINQLGYGSDIVVATPGRLIDLYDRGVIALNKIRYFVLDEADRMLDMGFEPSIRYIVEKSGLPSAEERNTLLFSATFPKEIQRLARDFLNSNYLFLTVGRVGSTTDNITQKFDFVDSFHEKKDLLLKRIEEVSGLCLVFVAKKVDADQIESFLMDNKIKAFAIHGDKTQRQREYALNSLKSGRVQALVATDVAARGLDIPDVNHVINFDLPNNIDDYVHRIGRTGRAGNKGIATAFFSNSNGNIARNLIELLETANQEIPDRLREAASSRGGGFRGGGRFGGGRFGGGRGGGGRFGGGRGGGRGGPRGSYGGNRW